MKSHYIYCAVGVRVFWRFFLPTFYIGVRTGILPDKAYKTSSFSLKRGEWVYLDKVVIETFETREQANEAEVKLLTEFAETEYWDILQNKAVYAGHALGYYEVTDEHRKNLSRSIQLSKWESFKDVWQYARRIYNDWEAFEMPNASKLARLCGLRLSQVQQMHKRFTEGWNPHDDILFDEWVDP